MRRIVFVTLTTVTAVVLLFSYHTSTNSAKVASTPVVRPRVSSGPASATYTGEVGDTLWGPVQVRITVRGGKITASEAVLYPKQNRREVEISGTALPMLGQEAVQKQSASIDTVSGATLTSDGYRRSLQSAIDSAHL
jgi:uncharacterized protein with FMN-binding domain